LNFIAGFGEGGCRTENEHSISSLMDGEPVPFYPYYIMNRTSFSP